MEIGAEKASTHHAGLSCLITNLRIKAPSLLADLPPKPRSLPAARLSAIVPTSQAAVSPLCPGRFSTGVACGFPVGRATLPNRRLDHVPTPKTKKRAVGNQHPHPGGWTGHPHPGGCSFQDRRAPSSRLFEERARRSIAPSVARSARAKRGSSGGS